MFIQALKNKMGKKNSPKCFKAIISLKFSSAVTYCNSHLES